MPIYDTSIGYLVIFVIPVIVYYLFKFRGKAFVFYSILSLAFTAGSIELLSGLEVFRILQFLEVLIWGLALYTFITSTKREIPHWPYLIGFLATCLVSFIITPVDLIQFILFLRRYLLFVAVFVLCHNLQLPEKDIENLLKFIILLFLNQILVNIARYPITGQTEPYIGTMSILNGSITAIFSLTGIAFCFSAFLFKKKISYIIFLCGFFTFSLIGLKRGHILIVPLVLFLQYITYAVSVKEISIKSFFKTISTVLIVICLLVYCGLVLVPSLNPEEITGGSFDPAYVIRYIDDYLNPGTAIQGIEYFGRGEAPGAVYELLQKKGWMSLLFGLGPGDIIMSRFTIPFDIIHGESFIAGMKYGIGYGSRTGVLFTTMQAGLAGMLLYFFFISKIFSSFLRLNLYTQHIPENKQIISLGLVGFWGIFIFDFFAYSQTSFQTIPIILPVCFAYHYSKRKPKDVQHVERCHERFESKVG